MPRGRKNGKNKKKRRIRSKAIQKQNEPHSGRESIVRSSLRDESPIDKSLSIRLTTPIRTPSPNLKCSDDESCVETTPINKQRSLTIRSRNESFKTLHVTNLRSLFDLDNDSITSIDFDKSTQTNVLNNSFVNSSRKRASSSMARLHSPGLEKVRLQTTISTQTESPKLSTVTHCCPLTPPYIFSINDLNSGTQWKTHDNKNTVDIRQKNYCDIVNKSSQNSCDLKYNPNIYPVPIKDSSIGDISGFNQNLFGLKCSSTPIVEKLSNCVKDNARKFKDSPLNDSKNTSNVDKTVKSNLMHSPTCFVDEHRTISGSKANALLKLLKSNKYNNSPICKRRQCRSFTPTISTPLKCSIIRKQSNKYSLNILAGSYNSNNNNNNSEPGGVFTRIKNYCRLSTDYVGEIGSQLANNFKKCFSNMWQLYPPPCENQCRCEEYQTEINSLTQKKHRLSSELRVLRTEVQELKILIMENKELKYNDLSFRLHEFSGEICALKSKSAERQETNEQFDKLKQEITAVRQELGQLKDIKSDLESVKQLVLCPKQITSTVSLPASITSIPPPPPPPPPPPALPGLSIFKKLSKLPITTENNKKSDKTRPIISLDDILKVKLRKTTDRPTPVRRHSTQPLVSMDMLKQVKLRPPSAQVRPTSANPNLPQTPKSSRESTSPVSTSPCSSLNRRNQISRRERD